MDVAVIGGGQAGLAVGHFLAAGPAGFTILEAGDAIGPAWRERWDSIVLFTPRRYDALPGMPFPGDPEGYPTRDEVIAYLERYAAGVRPAGRDSAARSARFAHATAAFTLELDDRTIEADQVVVATGPFQTPRIPALADGLAPEVVQTHSAGYRAPGDLPDGTVLVVGGGNTGYQIAKELSATHDVHLAVGSRQTPAPAAAARPRPLLVAHEARRHAKDGGLADGAADAGPGHADRLEPAQDREAWRDAPATRRLGVRAHGAVRRRHRGRRGRASSGRPASASTTRGSTCRSRTRAGRCGTSAG